MFAIRPFFVSTILSFASAISYAQSSVVVEWAPFIKAVDIPDPVLIHAADKVTSEFLTHQAGFIKRELVKKSDSEYSDIIHWNTKSDATAAANKVATCSVCSEYFELMNISESDTSGAGFAYFSVLKTWSINRK